VTTPHFVLLMYAASSPGAAPRLGVTASRRIGPSVIRNRAKRLIREAFRATPELWEAGVDLVVIARRPPSKLKLADVVEEWRNVAKPIRRRAREALKDRETRETSLADGGQRSQTRPGTA
jgi:ribonuclease P protein component